MTPAETPIDRRTFASLLATPFVLPALGRLDPLRSLVAPKPITPPSAEFLKGLPRMMEIAGVPGVAMGVVKDGRGRLEPPRGADGQRDQTARLGRVDVARRVAQ